MLCCYYVVTEKLAVVVTFSNVWHSAFLLQDGILVGAVGAYDWNGAVLKETRQGKVVPPKSSYTEEFPEELKNHGAYLGK